MRPISQENWQYHATLNIFHTLLIFLLMLGLLALLGVLVWGREGLLLLVFIVGGPLLLAPGINPEWVMRTFNARLLDIPQARGVKRMLAGLAARAGLSSTPRLYYISSDKANAFSVGTPRHAAIAITEALILALDADELEAVLAHEISHIRNNDMRVMGLADMLTRITQLLSFVGQIMLVISLPLFIVSKIDINWMAIFVLIIAPYLSALAQLKLSRTREFNADINAVSLTANPQVLSRALLKIEAANQPVKRNWFWRVNYPERHTSEPSLLRSHPSTEQRIQRLQDLYE